MVSLTNLLKQALKNHYPRNHKTINSEEYPSLTEKYNEWLTTTYVNGTYYFGEELPDSLGVINRKILKVFTIYNLDNTGENKYGIGVVVQGFKSDQILKLKLPDEDNDVEFTYKNYKVIDKEENISLYGELLSPHPVYTVELYCDELVDDYLTYTSVPSTIYTSTGVFIPNLNYMGYDDFMNHYVETMGKVQSIQTSFDSSTGEFVLDFFILDQSDGDVYFYTGNNERIQIHFEEFDNSVSFNVDGKSYVRCWMLFSDGVDISFRINTVDTGSVSVTDYNIRFP